MLRLLPAALLTIFFFVQCKEENEPVVETQKAKEIRQDSIIETYVTNCAQTYNYRMQRKEWQTCLDRGLKIDTPLPIYGSKKPCLILKSGNMKLA